MNDVKISITEAPELLYYGSNSTEFFKILTYGEITTPDNIVILFSTPEQAFLSAEKKCKRDDNVVIFTIHAKEMVKDNIEIHKVYPTIYYTDKIDTLYFKVD